MSDHAHVVRLVEYVFSDGHAQVYVEVIERGARYEGARLVCLSAAVHALLNLRDEELWEVGNRPVDWRNQSTG